MKRFCTLLMLLSLSIVTGNAFGQTERFELFSGYSPLRNFAGEAGSTEHFDTMHGWNASLTTNIKPWIGITADFSGHYDGQFVRLDIATPNGQLQAFLRSHKFMSHRGMVGPQVKLRNGRWEPFGYALFGVNRVSVGEGQLTALGPFPIDQSLASYLATYLAAYHDSGFAWAVGGGLDLKLSDKVKIRLIQADYTRSRTSVGREGLRTSFGLVFPF